MQRDLMLDGVMPMGMGDCNYYAEMLVDCYEYNKGFALALAQEVAACAELFAVGNSYAIIAIELIDATSAKGYYTVSVSNVENENDYVLCAPSNKEANIEILLTLLAHKYERIMCI